MEIGIMMLEPVIKLCVPAIRINIKHKQAIKVGSFKIVEEKPFTIPIRQPTRIATGMDTQGAIFFAAMVAQAQANPAIAPIEKSRLPVDITNTPATDARKSA